MNLNSLIEKLHPECRASLESAAAFCLSLSHFSVEVEHWLIKLLENAKSDLGLIANYYSLNFNQLNKQLNHFIYDFKTGNSQSPVLSRNLIDLIKEALLLAQLEFNDSCIRSSYLLISFLTKTAKNKLVNLGLAEFDKINLDQLKNELSIITANSCENILNDQSLPQEAMLNKGNTFLEQFTINLTQMAAEGQIDPVIGREDEVRQLIDILLRRRQNNPILIGEPGVGKTAIVEGFALAIVNKQVPQVMQNVALHILDLGLLQAGAGIKGEFEHRLKSVIGEIKQSTHPIILFIDEAHTLIGAGSAPGQTDAANLLKPMLARGELRTIAATTWSEYKKYFEQDPALVRRFQAIKIEEPSEEVAIHMLRGLISPLEKHHGVAILDEAIRAAVHLSHRYISHRFLPDKAISVLDTTAARLASSDNVDNPSIIKLRQEISFLDREIDIKKREYHGQGDGMEIISDLINKKKDMQDELSFLEHKLKKERRIIDKISHTKAKIEILYQLTQASPEQQDKLQLLHLKCKKYSEQLKKIQADKPLLHACVDEKAVAEMISSWTGIPLGRICADKIASVLNLEHSLENKIIGQYESIKLIMRQIQIGHAQLADPGKPIASFLFVGPSGVGKTETALALAELLYGGRQNLTVINLSEFKEEHKVSLLMGSPPGYVGYGEGGILTEAVRRKPYSLLLLDEVDKAHPSVQDIFYQVLDKGVLKDGQGRDINFKNTIIIFTANTGGDLITKLVLNEKSINIEEISKKLWPELLQIFKSSFLGRLTLLPFLPLSENFLRQIVELKLNQIKHRIVRQHNVALSFDASLPDYIMSRCRDVETGARNVDQVLNNTVLSEISLELLRCMASGVKARELHIGLTEKAGILCRACP